jgi:hypothetical protein
MAKAVVAARTGVADAGAAVLAAPGAARKVAPKMAAIVVMRVRRHGVDNGISVLTLLM